VLDGYFIQDEFVQGHMIDNKGRVLTGTFVDLKINGAGELKTS